MSTSDWDKAVSEAAMAMAHHQITARKKAEAQALGAYPSTRVPGSDGVNPSRYREYGKTVDNNVGSAADKVVSGAGLNAPYDADKRYQMFDNALAVTESFDAMYRAMDEPWNEIGYEGIGGGQADRVRHFYWQGKLTQKYGPVGAALLGLAHEIEGFADQSERFAKGKLSLDDLMANYLGNIEDTRTNAKANVTVALTDYLRKLEKMQDLDSDELREMAIDYATGVPRKERMKKRDAYLKELKDSPEYTAWQDKTIDAAIRGKNPPPMPNTLLEAIERKEMEKRT